MPVPEQGYPRNQWQKLYTKLYGDTFTLGAMVAPRTFVAEWSAASKINLVVNYDFHKITIYFEHLRHEYKAEFKFDALEEEDGLIVDQPISGLDIFAFTMKLQHPAAFWIKKQTGMFFKDDQWERVVSLPRDEEAERSHMIRLNAPVQIGASSSEVNFASWTTYRFQVSIRKRVQMVRYKEMLVRLSSYRVVPRPVNYFPGKIIHVGARTGTVKTFADRAQIIEDFDKLYALETMVSMRVFSEYNLDDAFYTYYNNLQPAVACDALRLLGYDKTWKPIEALEKIMHQSRYHQVGKPRKTAKGCVLLHKVFVKPTSIQIERQQVETTNRVIRHFGKYMDRFLRVQFVDEDENLVHMSSNRNHTIDWLYFRIGLTLRNGIQIGDRHYEFLAFSSSQLRDHGCWFFAGTPDLDVRKIREWMGDFSSEKVVAKFAARMGQCFSDTSPITKLKPEEVQQIPDIAHNSYTFSDGVGRISKKLGIIIAKRMNMAGKPPSAFQIRLGGAKGVLSLHEALKGKCVQLRPSQIKFESQHRMLEVIRVAKYSPVNLNRQAILILSSLGVPDEVFISLHDDMVRDIDAMHNDPVKASYALRMNADEFGINKNIARLVDAGLLESGDAYTCNMVNIFRLCKLKDIKKRARIMVRDGAFLLGIVDESNTLKENQVFCQLAFNSYQTSESRKIITGECVLYRNPCLHPGDVRVVEAVDCPALHDLCNVIVFSAQGERDVPSMCSGGDLDGDLYSLIWDNQLLPDPEKRNVTPMESMQSRPVEVGNVEIEDIQSFFVDHIKNDNLGIIANAHMAIADFQREGVFHEDCKKLARLHSTAVDFAKTGVVAEMPNELRPKTYPDFMEKFDKPSYESQKILGILYRSIDVNRFSQYREVILESSDYDVRLWMSGMERYVKAARRLKRRYDRDVQDLLNQYGIPTESELLSGYVIRWYKMKGRKNQFEILRRARRSIAGLRDRWYKDHFPAHYGRDRRSSRIISTCEQREEEKVKAAAWYYVTYHPVERDTAQDLEARNYTHRKKKWKISFPWVAQDILCQLLKANASRPREEQYMRAIPETTILSYNDGSSSDNDSTFQNAPSLGNSLDSLSDLSFGSITEDTSGLSDELVR